MHQKRVEQHLWLRAGKQGQRRKEANMHISNRYSKPEEYGIVEVPLPKLRDNDILVKVKACGVCGTDLHIHEGEFIAKVCGRESFFIHPKK
jgi:hypothetical protein